MSDAAAPAVRVLVVDDAPDLRLVVRSALERRGGFEVVEAGDGDEAVRVAAASDPDIVLLDLDMPRVGGLEALPLLRETVPRAKVVILSGVTRDPMERLARSAGAVGYLEKGIPSRRLVDELMAVAGLLDAVEGAVAESRVTLDREIQAPGAARRFVDETLRRWASGEAIDTVELLVSELVTNAVVHARSEAEVAVVLRRDTIRVEVADGSSDLPQPRDAKDYEPSGRGLKLVDALASAWGVDVVDDGKVVWFEIPRADGDAIIR
jgi:DNA-binding NarL/FixJ family response regulator